MKTTVSLSRNFGSISLSESTKLTLAISSAVVFFTAILLSLDLFAYLCGIAALAAVRSLEKKGGSK